MRTVIPLAAAAAMLGLSGTAQANVGILTCQMLVTEFVGDVAAGNVRMGAGDAERVNDFIEVARSQCRSGTGIVVAELSALRNELGLSSGMMGPQAAMTRYDDFWPVDESELLLDGRG